MSESDVNVESARSALLWNASLRLQQGQSPAQVEAALVDRGLSPEEAAEMVQRAARGESGTRPARSAPLPP
jgi:hypothetical protein